MRPFSPPLSTFTDFFVWSPGEQQAAERGAHELVVVGLAGVGGHPREQVDLVRELGLRILRHVAGLRVLDPVHLALTSGVSSPARQRISVVLPMPLGPMIAMRSPASTVKLMLRSTSTSVPG